MNSKIYLGLLMMAQQFAVKNKKFPPEQLVAQQRRDINKKFRRKRKRKKNFQAQNAFLKVLKCMHYFLGFEI